MNRDNLLNKVSTFALALSVAALAFLGYSRNALSDDCPNQHTPQLECVACGGAQSCGFFSGGASSCESNSNVVNQTNSFYCVSMPTSMPPLPGRRCANQLTETGNWIIGDCCEVRSCIWNAIAGRCVIDAVGTTVTITRPLLMDVAC